MIMAVNERFDSMFNWLQEKGFCSMCSFRFLPNFKFENIFEENRRIIENYENKRFANETKMKKLNPCIVCLDILSDSVDESVKRQISSSEVSDFDCDSFMVALTIPLACQMRERVAATFLKSSFPDHYGDDCFIPRLGIKEAWRNRIHPKISELIGKTYHAKSELIIQVTFCYDDDSEDCCKIENCVNTTIPKYERINLQTDEMKSLKESNLAFPFSVPTKGLRCQSVTVRRDSLFLAGRYNKFSRVLPQTPWIFADGERKMDTSLEEIITIKLKEWTNARESRFSSSGREDVDVRMLGNGRPFAVELINAKITAITFHNLRLVEKEINNVDARSVLIRDLQIVSRNEMQFLKNGEENKTKYYSAICMVNTTKSFEDMIKALPVTPFHITQKTPLRVLHRRTVAARKKIIHQMNIQLLNTHRLKRCVLMKLNIQTQAGTYVKEFIHGDFARTFPSISYMLGGVPVEVLNLDVLNVDVDWPIPINYKEII